MSAARAGLVAMSWPAERALVRQQSGEISSACAIQVARTRARWLGTRFDARFSLSGRASRSTGGRKGTGGSAGPPPRCLSRHSCSLGWLSRVALARDEATPIPQRHIGTNYTSTPAICSFRRLGPEGGGASTSQGRPLTVFARALQHGNLVVAEATARELGRISLAEALEPLTLIAKKEPARLSKVGVRWLQRYLEEEQAGLEDVALAVSALSATSARRTSGRGRAPAAGAGRGR